jgi:hypothetical protein
MSVQFVICIEMFVFALAHHRLFSYKDYPGQNDSIGCAYWHYRRGVPNSVPNRDMRTDHTDGSLAQRDESSTTLPPWD